MNPLPTLPRPVSLSVSLSLCAALAAQASLPLSLSPNGSDLSGKTAVPFACANARAQWFYEARELPSTTLIVGRLLLRYDGPAAGAAKTHTIQKLTLQLGATALDTGALGASFAANLTQPLAPALVVSPFQYQTDATAQAGPEAFGGPGGQLRFVLPSPVVVVVPPGGALVLEATVEGNTNAGQDVADLDLHVDPTAAQGQGSAQANGRGCPTDLFGHVAMLETAGTYQPGTAILLSGTGYPPSTPIFMLLTAQTLGTPLALPGTNPICWIYLDLATGNLEPLAVSSPTGTFNASGGGSALPIPKGPGMCGAKLYVQTASTLPVSSGNLLGFETSNYRTVTLGCASRPVAGAWTVAHPGSATAPVGTFAFNGAPALRIE